MHSIPLPEENCLTDKVNAPISLMDVADYKLINGNLEKEFGLQNFIPTRWNMQRVLLNSSVF